MEPNPAQANTPVTPVNQAPPQPENPVQMPVDPQPLEQTPPIQPSVDTLSGVTPPSPLVKKKSSKMKWLIIIILLAVLAVSIALGGYYFLSKGGLASKPSTPTVKTTVVIPIPSPTSELVGKFIWDVKKLNLTPTEIEIKNAFASYVATPSTAFNDNRRLAVVSLNVSSISANFAFASVGALENNSSPAGSLATWLVYKNNNTWQIITSNATNYCEVLKTYPSDLLTQNVKDYFSACFSK